MAENNTKVTGNADMVFPNRSLFLYILHGFKEACRNPEAKKDEDEMNTIADVYSIWAKLVRYYSVRGLTDERDKLPAITSLSLEIQNLLGSLFFFCQGNLFGVQYFELQGLLWRAKCGHTLKRPQTRRAASWSWVSVDGAIEFLDMMINGRSTHNFADLWHPHDTDLKVLGVYKYETPDMP